MNSQTYLKWGRCNQATAPLLMKKLSVIIKKSDGNFSKTRKHQVIKWKYKITKKVVFNSIFQEQGASKNKNSIIMITVW